MSVETTPLLLKVNPKQLKLPTMLAEWEKLAREAAAKDEAYESYLLRLTEAEVTARSANALAARIRAAGFPVTKDFDTFDFAACPSLSKQKVLELSRGEWIEQRFNCCLIGNAGTGKTHVATSLGLAICRLGRRVKFVTAAALVTQLEEAQQQHRLDRLLSQLDRLDLLIVDELGYLSFSCSGAELLFQVFAERYERRSLLDEQPGVQRVGSGLPGRSDDGGAVGPADAPLPHLRDERGELPLPRVDEGQEGERPSEGFVIP